MDSVTNNKENQHVKKPSKALVRRSVAGAYKKIDELCKAAFRISPLKSMLRISTRLMPLPSMGVIDLSGAIVTEKTVQRLLTGSPGLRSASFAGCRTVGVGGIEMFSADAVVALIPHACSRIEYLDLSGIDVNVCLAPLVNCFKLEVLKLAEACDSIEDFGSETWPQIKALDVSGSYFGSLGLLRRTFPNLESFRGEGAFGLGSDWLLGDPYEARRLDDLLQEPKLDRSKQLEKVDLLRKRQRCIEMANQTIEHLDVSGVEELDDWGLRNLVVTFPNVRQLQVAGCTQLTGEGICALLPHLEHLVAANVADCPEVDAVDLTRLLTKLSRLQTLGISVSQIGVASAHEMKVVVSAFFETNSELQTLLVGDTDRWVTIQRETAT